MHPGSPSALHHWETQVPETPLSLRGTEEITNPGAAESTLNVMNSTPTPHKTKFSIADLVRKDAELSAEESKAKSLDPEKVRRHLAITKKMEAGLCREHAEQAFEFQELSDKQEAEANGQSEEQRRKIYEEMNRLAAAPE